VRQPCAEIQKPKSKILRPFAGRFTRGFAGTGAISPGGEIHHPTP